MVVFICLYRRVLNEKGWEKLKENNLCEGENTNEEYCEVKDAEYAPDSSNIFMIDYFPQYIQNKMMLNTSELFFLGIDSHKVLKVILLIKNLCSWLYVHKFTHAKVEFNRGNSGTSP
jgi:hypothetical protein